MATTGIELIEEFLAEEKLISNFLMAEKAYNDVCTKIDDVFIKNVRKLISEYKTNPQASKERYLELIVGIRNRCPYEVTKIFIQDLIRENFTNGN